jgi:signal transduction histidine kinase
MAKFKVQARILDLLGEQQIANGPTAISELFKNAHDAYAEHVKLDIYPDDDRALLWDDGVGMSERDLLERWLVVGTSGKKTALLRPAPPPGFVERPIQGEKGIGRLAISTLGDCLLLISKKRRQEGVREEPYAALFINWKVVHNLNLMLSDIEVPVLTFTHLDELSSSVVKDMVDAFRRSLLEAPENLWAGKTESNRRDQILQQLDQFEYLPTFAQRTGIEARDSGTLFYVRNIRPDLKEYDRAPSSHEEEEHPPSEELVQLLSNFRNRFSDRLTGSNLNYAFDVDVRCWRRDDASFLSIFQNWQAFEPDDLQAYDHKIDVRFDNDGRCEGTIEVFGRMIALPPARQLAKRLQSCGPFELRLWYFQGKPDESRLTAEQFFLMQERLRRFGGLMIYRDGLRVLPYGQTEMDWLGFEERRSRNAGRHFFSYRRMFGYVAIGASSNPNLLDKSGREGLISNGEYRNLRQRLIVFFGDVAAQYFSKNQDFERAKEELVARAGLVGKQQQRAAERREALKRDLSRALQHMHQSGSKLDGLVEGSLNELRALTDPGERELTAAFVSFRDKLNRIESVARVNIPRTLSVGRDRDARRLIPDYNEAKGEFDAACRKANESFDVAIKSIFPEAERAAARHNLLKNALFQARARVGKAYAALVSAREDEIEQLDQALMGLRNEQQARIDKALFAETHADNAEDALLSSVGELSNILDAIGRAAEESCAVLDERSDELTSHLRGFHAEHHEAVLAAQTDEIEQLRAEVDQNLDLVQLGLTVEVIDHELNKLYRSIADDLGNIAEIVQNYLPAVQSVNRLRAHFQHLEQRYKLMSPLFRGTHRTKSEISGTEILEYVRALLKRSLDATGVTIRASSRAHAFKIREMQSIILPVFVNLVDNAVYWLRHASDKQIMLDVRDGVMTVCDSGPGIHSTMLESIFELFFTTKPNGRGLGLYVAKANLERHGHKIWATNDAPYKTLSGACFCIQFNPETIISGSKS